MEFLWGTLAFLTGWLVCWIQMSKSESRKVQQLQYLADSRLEALKSRQKEKSELKSQLRELTTRLIWSDHRLWEFQQDQKLQSESPVSQSRYLVELQLANQRLHSDCRWWKSENQQLWNLARQLDSQQALQLLESLRKQEGYLDSNARSNPSDYQKHTLSAG